MEGTRWVRTLLNTHEVNSLNSSVYIPAGASGGFPLSDPQVPTLRERRLLVRTGAPPKWGRARHRGSWRGQHAVEKSSQELSSKGTYKIKLLCFVTIHLQRERERGQYFKPRRVTEEGQRTQSKC